MNEEIEKRVHEFAEQMYNAGYADRCLLTDEECIKDQKNQYEKGLKDAWECAKKIAIIPRNGGLSCDEMDDIFHTKSVTTIMNNYSASEAIEKIKAYEEKQNQIHVGDELVSDYDNNERYVVTRIVSQDYINMMDMNGAIYSSNPERYKKTGRHFSQIEELLDQMQEESDE